MPDQSLNDYVTRREFQTEIRRLDERRESAIQNHLHLISVESSRVNGRMETEANRINAILLASAQNVREASVRAETTAAKLAERVDASAKALVSQVESTARANVDAVAAAAMAMSARIKPLEELRFEQAGRSGITTPLLMLIATFAGALLLFLIQTFMHS